MNFLLTYFIENKFLKYFQLQLFQFWSTLVRVILQSKFLGKIIFFFQHFKWKSRTLTS